MSDDDLDLAMQARMAEEDVARFRDALHPVVFPSSSGRPSDATLISFAVQRIKHSFRVAPDNPLGRTEASTDVTSDNAVAVLHGVIADLRAMRTDEGYRLSLILGDLLPEHDEEAKR